jgi:segregation and condensation protein B
MAARKKQPPVAAPRTETAGSAADSATAASLGGRPSDGGLSIDRLAQAFAAMMGGTETGSVTQRDVVQVDASPDLDADAARGDDGSIDDAADVRVSPLSIFEALLFVGRPDGRPLTSRMVAGLMRGVRPEEVADLAAELSRRYRAAECPYDVVTRQDGWLLRLRPEYTDYGSVLEQRTRTVRLDAEALDVLAVVAWNQPVPRDKLVELGCDARPATLRQLVRRGLLELRHPAEGDEPPTYHTTAKFLEVFRLERLEDLPDPTAPPA